MRMSPEVDGKGGNVDCDWDKGQERGACQNGGEELLLNNY